MSATKHGPWGWNDLMAVCAFRYACGSRTYIVGVCADWIIDQWAAFPDNVRTLIKRDLEREFERDDEARARGDDYKPLGMDFDRKEWERVRALWSEKK